MTRELGLYPPSIKHALILSLIVAGSLCLPELCYGKYHANALNSSHSRAAKLYRQNADNPVDQLIFGSKKCKTLALNHTDIFEFDVIDTKSVGYVHLEVMQNGVDVTLILSGPGDLSIRRDWPNGRYGLEVLSVELAAAGKYTLRIEGTDAETKEGAEYCLRSESKERPTANDLKRIEAEKRFAEALDQLDKSLRPLDPTKLVAAVGALKGATELWRGIDDYGYATALTTYGYNGAILARVLPKDVAVGLFKETLFLWEKIGDLRRQAQSFYNIGQVYDNANQINEADENYTRALALFKLPETPKVPLEEASTLNNLATIKQQEGYYSDALELLDRAVKRLQEGHNSRREATSLNNMGVLYVELQEYERADHFYKRAQEVRGKPEVDKEGWATTLNNLALSRAYQGDLEQATQLLAEALTIRTNAPQSPRIVENRYSQAFVMNMRGDFDGALAIFEKEILPKLDQNPFRKAITLGSIGSIYRSKGDKQKALQAFRAAFDTSSSLTNPSVLSLILFNLGRAEMEVDSLDLADDHLRRAITLIEERRTRVINPEWRATYFASTRDVYETYVELLIRTGKTAKALEYSERSRARTLLDLLLEAKVDIYNEPQNADRAKQYRAAQREVEAQQTRLQGLEFAAVPETRKAEIEARKAEIKKRIGELSSQLRVLDAAIKRDSNSYHSVQPEPLTVDGIQKLLDGNTVLLEFLLANDRSYLWILSNTGDPTVIPLPSRSKIETDALEVYGLLTVRDKDNPIRTANSKGAPAFALDAAKADRAYPAVGAKFSKMLLGQASRLIAGKRLLIVPDGALALLPFAALPIPSPTVANQSSTNWTPLLLEHIIVTLPSATTLSVQREIFRDRPIATKTLAVIADPVFDSNDEPHRCEKPPSKVPNKNSVPFYDSRSRSTTLGRAFGRTSSPDEVVKLPRLQFTQQEMKTILGVSRGIKLGACGFDANYDVATTQLSDFRYLHFATHGLVNVEHPELSGVVLTLVDRRGNYTPEGFLRLTEIYELQLQADLVVLSACYTALGRDIKGEGPISLTRGFMNAGAKRVVASLWQVKDKSTATLMKYFYQGMMGTEDLPAATALQRAQIRVRQEHPDWPPFFWAAFIAQGEYN